MTKFLQKISLLAIMLMVGVSNVWAEDPTVLFHETFGNNTGSVRAWSDSYSEKSGVATVYSNVSYTITNAKQGKNTTGKTSSGINQTTQGTDAVFEFGPLNVKDYSNLNLSYYWKAASVNGTYSTSIYYKTTQDGTYVKITPSAKGATSFVQVSEDLPEAAQVSTLYLKIIFNTSNTQAIIDEVELTGKSSVVKTLDKITVSDYKTTFNLNDDFEFGGTVLASYKEDGIDDVDVTNTGNVSYSGYDMSQTGSQTVTVSYTEGGITKTAEYTITVNAVNVESVELNKSELEIYATKTYTLIPTITPANATNQNVIWSSDNESVATVVDGVVTGVSEGTAEITATTQDGNKTATCTVTVKPFIKSYANTFTSNISDITENKDNYYVEIDNVSYQALKKGKGESISITVPANTKTLHVHMVAWNGEGGNSNPLAITNIPDVSSQVLVADANVSGSGKTYELSENIDPIVDCYFSYPMNNTEDVVVTFTPTDKKRFVLFGVNAEQFKTVEITSIGWATACVPFKSTVSGATAYYVKFDGEYLVKSEANVIPAGAGVLLKGTEGSATTATFTASAADEDSNAETDNMMIGSLAGETFSTANTKYYILANDATYGIGFYYQGATNKTGSTVECAAGKAVLAVTSSSSAKEFLPLDDATSISHVENAVNVENVGNIYNLAGQKVGADYKGIVIVNGKKYLNK